MATQRISEKALQAIDNDNGLAAAVCDAMGIKFSSLPIYMRNKSVRFTMFKVVNIIAEKTGLSTDEIVEDVDEVIEG